MNLVAAALFNPFIVLTVVVVSFLYLLRRDTTKTLNLPPSPPRLPLIGNLHQLGKLPFQSFTNLSKKYGPLMFIYFGQSPTLIVSSAEAAQEIIKNHDIVFSNRPRQKSVDMLFRGCQDMAFCPYGEYWRQTRKVCTLELLSQRRVNHFAFIREEEVMKMATKIRRSCSNGKPVNLAEMFVNISNNMISRAALGKTYENEEGDNIFGQLTRSIIDLLGAVCVEDLIPQLAWIDVLTGLTGKLENTSQALRDFLDQVIEEHRGGLKIDDERKDLVDILLQLQKDGQLGFELSQPNLRAILMDMFIGGTDTIATAMEWSMAELLKNPRIMKRAQEEVRKVVGKKSKVEEADVDKMHYINCIVKETLRFHVAAVIPRETSVSAKVAGYDIPPKTKVFINTWGIQRDPKLWNRANEFYPERFFETPLDIRGQNTQYLPFGYGRRVCPGISYGFREVEYVLASFLYLFDWKLPNGAHPEDLDMSEVHELVVRKRKPLMAVPVEHFP